MTDLLLSAIELLESEGFVSEADAVRRLVEDTAGHIDRCASLAGALGAATSQNAALADYIERMAKDHEEERAEVILNAQKVRRVAAKIAAERNELRERLADET